MSGDRVQILQNGIACLERAGTDLPAVIAADPLLARSVRHTTSDLPSSIAPSRPVPRLHIYAAGRISPSSHTAMINRRLRQHEQLASDRGKAARSQSFGATVLLLIHSLARVEYPFPMASP